MSDIALLCDPVGHVARHSDGRFAVDVTGDAGHYPAAARVADLPVTVYCGLGTDCISAVIAERLAALGAGDRGIVRDPAIRPSLLLDSDSPAADAKASMPRRHRRGRPVDERQSLFMQGDGADVFFGLPQTARTIHEMAGHRAVLVSSAVIGALGENGRAVLTDLMDHVRAAGRPVALLVGGDAEPDILGPAVRRMPWEPFLARVDWLFLAAPRAAPADTDDEVLDAIPTLSGFARVDSGARAGGQGRRRSFPELSQLLAEILA